MELFIITFFLISIAFTGLAIKIIFKKNGEFTGTCASQSPFLNSENKACSICGKITNGSECARE
tara:strand:- start:439 stop:630 length:192 start_codon:yes stop_codon:yes gene_type:complete